MAYKCGSREQITLLPQSIKEQYQDKLKDIDIRIEKLLEECDRIDEEEKEDGSLVKMEEELIDQKKLRERIKGILAEFETKGELNKDGAKRTVNRTDPDSALMQNTLLGT